MTDLITEAGFRSHIQKQRYSILHQPVVCAKSGDVLHYEWLVRFDGISGLERVLRPAEISGAISDLDLSMLKQAVTALNEDEGHPAIAVNLSGASFSENFFEPSLLHILSGLAAPPAKLIFELTETWDLRDLNPARRLLDILRAKGHQICLDDVGAGAASIRYLRAFPTDWLKIDGEFVAGAMKNPREKEILAAIMGLKQALQVKFIAEGIETLPLKDFALSMGFDALQGFVLGIPAKNPEKDGQF